MSTTVKTVTSQSNPLAYLKAIATLIGTIATALLGVYTADTPVGKVLTIASIIATAIATWVVPNALVIPATIETEDEGLVEVEDTDNGLSYEESGGLPFPADADEPTLYKHEDGNPDRY